MFLARPATNPYGTMRVARKPTNGSPNRPTLDPTLFAPAPATAASDAAAADSAAVKVATPESVTIVEKAAPVFNQAGSQLFGLDAELELKRREKHDPEYDNKALKWLSEVTGDKIDLDNWQESLKSGITLCKLANLAVPNAVRFDLRPIPLVERENIAKYLYFCGSWGFESSNMFGISDLYEKKSLESVIGNIYAMARVVERANGFKGPSLTAKPVQARSMIVRNVKAARTNVMDVWTNALKKDESNELVRSDPALPTKLTTPEAFIIPERKKDVAPTPTPTAAVAAAETVAPVVPPAASKPVTTPTTTSTAAETFSLPQMTTKDRVRMRLSQKFFEKPANDEDSVKRKLQRRREKLAAMVEKERKEQEEREKTQRDDSAKAAIEALEKKEREILEKNKKVADRKVAERAAIAALRAEADKEEARLKAEEEKEKEIELELEREREQERERERQKQKEQERAEKKEQEEKAKAAEAAEAALAVKSSEPKTTAAPASTPVVFATSAAATPETNALIYNGFAFLVLYALLNIFSSSATSVFVASSPSNTNATHTGGAFSTATFTATTSTTQALQNDCVLNALLLLFLGHALMPLIRLGTAHARMVSVLALGFAWSSIARSLVLPYMPQIVQSVWLVASSVAILGGSSYVAYLVYKQQQQQQQRAS